MTSITIYAFGSYVDSANEAVRIYEEKHPNVLDVQVTQFDTRESLCNALLNGDTPDIAFVDDRDIKSIVKGNSNCIPITDCITDFSMDNYLSQKAVNTHGYALPYSTGVVAMYYRNDIFGTLDESITWDEFILLGEIAQQNDMYLLSPIQTDLPHILALSSGSEYSEAKTEIKKSVDMLQKLIQENLIHPNCTLDEKQITQLLENGTVATLIGGSEWLSNIKNLSVPSNWSVTSMPMSKVFPLNVSVGGCSCMMFHRENLNNTADFLKETLASDLTLSYNMAKKNGIIPSLKSAVSQLDTIEFEIAHNTDTSALTFLSNMAESVPAFEFRSNTDEITEKLNTGIEKLFDNTMTTSEILGSLDETFFYDDRLLDHIEIVSAPEENTVLIGESASALGISAVAHYTNGTKERIANDELSFPEDTFQNTGDQIINVSFTKNGITKKAELPIQVIDRNLTSIEIHKTPITKYIQGESFDPTGMCILATYKADNITVKRYIHSGFQVDAPSIFNEIQLNRKLTVTYEDNNITKTTSLTVSIVDSTVRGIQISGYPYKNEYKVGEQFNSAGLVVRALYDNDTHRDIPDRELKYETDIVERSYINISYTQNQRTFNTKYEPLILSKEMVNRGIHQTRLNYNCTAGEARVNLFEGSMSFEHPDISIGANSYQINISHFYNTNGFYMSPEKGICMGNRWKLNVQQYLYRDSYYAFNKQMYSYVDGAGNTHLFKELDDSRYFDIDGLGLILTVGTDQNIISDQYGNKMYFENNVLVKTQSCHNNSMVTYYDYTNGKLTSVYDGRKPNTKIQFYYDEETGLLQKMSCEHNQSVKQELLYFYDSTQNLIRIQKKIGTNSKNVALFTYSRYGDPMMHMAVDAETGSAFSFTYRMNSEQKELIDSVETGIATCNDADIESTESFSFSFVSKDYNEFTYYLPESTVVDNGKIRMYYHFNINGITTSILEKDKALEKSIGVSMLSGYNLRRPFSVRKSQVLIDDDSPNLNDINHYRRGKCPDYKHFACSFWLKFANCTSISANVQLEITPKNKKYSKSIGKTVFDGSARNVWQKVEIPIEIPFDHIGKVELNFTNTESIKIADMRLYYKPLSKVTVGSNFGLDDFTNIKYYSLSENEAFTRPITRNCYMTVKDLQTTYLSMHQDKSEFILSLCNGTEKHLVSYARLCYEKNEETLTIDDPQLVQTLISPDENTCINGYLLFDRDLYGNPLSGICQCTEAFSKSARLDFYPMTVVDYKGNVIKEVDEYDITTEYEYDQYGDLKSKIIGGELMYNVSRTENQTYETDQLNYKTTHYQEPFGYVSKTEFNDLEDHDHLLLSKTYTLDIFGEKISSIQNNDDGKNQLSYDSHGRLQQVTPTGFNASNGYGFEFEYDKFGNPDHYYLIHGTNKEKQLLASKTVGQQNGLLHDYKYRIDESSPDETIIVMDRYGKTETIQEKNYNGTEYNTEFQYQDLPDSPAAAKVEKMSDPYENVTYSYSYDDFNNCTRYEANFHDTSDTLIILKTGENQVTYSMPNFYLPVISETEYQRDAILDPRVKKTVNSRIDLNSGKNVPFEETEYTYDHLGRIESKQQVVEDGLFGQYTTITVRSKYTPQTNLKSEVETTIKNKIVSDSRFLVTHLYGSHGQIEFSQYKKDNSVLETHRYYYDRSDRLTSESSSEGTTYYSYYPDGTLKTENRGSIYKTRTYQKGRLVSISDGSHFAYDNIGNCTHYMCDPQGSANMEWERGNLLKKYTTVNASYCYNSQGVRFKKTVGDEETYYYLDGGKLLSEKRSSDKKTRSLLYLYDTEGIIGFVCNMSSYPYYFVKDGTGNVIAILDHDKEVARYEYDAWGNCKVLDPDGTKTAVLISSETSTRSVGNHCITIGRAASTMSMADIILRRSSNISVQQPRKKHLPMLPLCTV